MDLKSRKAKLKRLLNKLFKNGIDLKDVTDKDEEKLLHPKTLSNFEKLVKRALERPKILEESQKIAEKMRERVAKQKALKQAKLDAKNQKFLNEHPQFKQVFKYDVKHNKSGDAELTAKSYMKARRERLLKEIFDTFSNVTPSMKKELTKMVNDSYLDIDLLDSMESVGQYLIYNASSDPEDVPSPDVDEFNSPDDVYINRLLYRYMNLKKKVK